MSRDWALFCLKRLSVNINDDLLEKFISKQRVNNKTHPRRHHRPPRHQLHRPRLRRDSRDILRYPPQTRDCTSSVSAAVLRGSWHCPCSSSSCLPNTTEKFKTECKRFKKPFVYYEKMHL